VSEIEFDQVLETIREAQTSYNKLVLIVGPMASGKTSLLQRIAIEMKTMPMNLGLLLSERMLGLTKRQRKLQVLHVARELIDEQRGTPCCVDNTETLFESALSLNPLEFLKAVSRNRQVIATWNGLYQGGKLSFGYAGHPDFFQEPVDSIPIILHNTKSIIISSDYEI
jgi:hypothetical protein